ncbi:hypothetical protein E2562_006159 [Oryza meyeriana var. granulata]|uniref:Uncharacterized protein n=1 Tax=Oryza meyeriana var. granulata TaxID=110450 RepID=A0A6G1EVS0_9ORYZ|nr:hypothetical protein E2562_006159 [Oryza meyeriana var. granulata]
MSTRPRLPPSRTSIALPSSSPSLPARRRVHLRRRRGCPRRRRAPMMMMHQEDMAAPSYDYACYGNVVSVGGNEYWQMDGDDDGSAGGNDVTL